MAQFREHDLRHALAGEVHARPFERLHAPAQATHMALLTGEGEGPRDREHLATLCRRHGLPPPDDHATHYSGDFGTFRCKWERHTEFASYTFYSEAAFEDPFADPAIDRVPRDWLAGIPGQLLVACHMAIEPRDAPPRAFADLHRIFAAESLTGSRMAGGNAEGWTDFRLHADGFGRILVRDVGLRSRQAGRLMQRLFEIETYRMMALLALPLARRAGSEISDAATELAGIADRMTAIEGLDDERAMLGRLTRLAARIEHLVSGNAYRFSAAQAYYTLVETRIAELREERIEGVQTVREFMDRRMAPAIRTCETTAGRQDRLAERIARATTLLRTRVEIAMEAQNRDLLRSMNRRAKLQLRLQETVEGLSVAAISYYLVGLVGYAAKGLHAAGVPLSVELVTGVSIPLVLLAVWGGMRLLRRRLTRAGAEGESGD